MSAQQQCCALLRRESKDSARVPENSRARKIRAERSAVATATARALGLVPVGSNVIKFQHTSMRTSPLKNLKPKVKTLAKNLIASCKKAGFRIRVVRGKRTKRMQDVYYAQGRTKPGKIITNVRGGYSFHN